jgi:hypothetical protein
MVREPILNKTSTFTTDPQFRHILGERNSTFSLQDAMQRGCWVVLNLHKGRLGEGAVTLGSLFLNMIKNALFSRYSRELFTLYFANPFGKAAHFGHATGEERSGGGGELRVTVARRQNQKNMSISWRTRPIDPIGSVPSETNVDTNV